MSKYKAIAEQEEEFVQYILKIGIEEKCSMLGERVNDTFYRFILKNGEVRYWKNLSRNHRKEVGWIDEK